MSGVWLRGCNVRAITLIWRDYPPGTGFRCSRRIRSVARKGRLFRRLHYFRRDELSQLTVTRQAVDGPAAGFDNRLFVK
jgi:hypothetical protein